MIREIKLSILILSILGIAMFTAQIFVNDITKEPLNIAARSTLNFNLSKQFEIKYPGNYSLQIALEKVDSASFKEIQEIIGDGTHDNAGNIIGNYKEYSIGWKVMSDNVNISGIGTHLTSGAGYSKAEIVKTIGVMSLPKGIMNLHVQFNTDLSELLKYNPRIVIEAGGIGAKTTQSSFTGNIILIYQILWLALPIITIVLVARLVYLHTKIKL